ncbi:MAG TPA: CcmD family protein [Caldilineae bacterium]|nr:CcmD family protein [Caldilineae bacterium]
MTYLAAAYGVIWLVVFILVFSMRRRQEKVVEQLETLEEIINEKQ